MEHAMQGCTVQVRQRIYNQSSFTNKLFDFRFVFFGLILGKIRCNKVYCWILDSDGFVTKNQSINHLKKKKE